MAVAEGAVDSRLNAIVEELALAVGRHGIAEGDPQGAKGVVRIEIEEHVKRVVKVYWTGFEANIPGQSVGVYIEVAEPQVHWAECYLSPDYISWVFCFRERIDGDIELLYYESYRDPLEAVDGLFKLAGWHILTATDLTWSDLVYTTGEGVPWSDHLQAIAGTSTSTAVQESLKKSTIIWLRWRVDGIERTMPVWFVFDNKTSKIYVLSGERQQMIPGAESLRECEVIFRWKGKNARIAEIPARVSVLQHGPEWDEVAEKVAEKRLNIPGLPEDTARRWRDECVLLELTLLT